ncbi:uncharacterized protein LOC125819831 [Solanum verrucosum]|uniref:uncharacterized protein LOC125819831 n=1 Tax=Solanum verrucosum TaxID=315347 RepID=UPI0020D03063|nr:uncharacterized protein LOC125819831 [Solanum verrucosum]
MQEVLKDEIIKCLDAGVVYLIAGNNWVCLVQCVPKKRGITVVPNSKNELVPMRPMSGWRVCMDNRKLNAWSEKDHFEMSFMDQKLDHLTGKGSLFGLCNALTTFKCCLMSIFSDMVEDTIEAFMDDFSVVGDSFEDFLAHLGDILNCHEKYNLVLN